MSLRRKLLRCIVGAFASLLVLAIVVVVFAPKLLESRVRSEIAKIKAQGGPVTAADLARTVPDSQNAAIIYEEIFRIIDTAPAKKAIEDASEISKFTANSDPALWLKAEQTVTAYRRIIPLVEKAASKPDCVFSINWNEENPMDITFFQYGRVRLLVRLLSISAIVDARNGRMDDAAKKLQLSYKVSESVKDQPTMIGQLVRVACLFISSRALERVLQHGDFTESQAKALFDVLAGVDLPSGSVTAIKGELATGIALFDCVLKHGPSFMDEKRESKPMRNWLADTRHFADELWYTGAMRRQIDQCSLPYREQVARGMTVEPSIPRYALISCIAYPLFMRFPQKRDAGMASVGGDRIALALMAHRYKYGLYPSSLDELKNRLGWPLPKDVLSGKDYIYHRKGSGFILYSVGQNLKDDGGVTVDPAVAKRGLVQVPRPAPGVDTKEILKAMDANQRISDNYIYSAPDGRKSADIIWSRER